MEGICSYCARSGRVIKNLCVGHYQQTQRGDELRPLRPRSRNGQRAECRFDDCGKRADRKGLCGPHAKQRAKGQALRPLAAKGAGSITANGYRLISKPGHPNAFANGKIPEHRWVMAEHLGRALLPEENVHHKNTDRLDNHLGNLELWTTSQPQGGRVADKLAWAIEFLTVYGYEIKGDQQWVT